MQKNSSAPVGGFLFLISILLMTGSIPARAGSAVTTLAVLKNCQNAAIAVDIRIEQCSELIRSNLVNHKMLGAFYAIRGGVYLEKPDYALALQDYDKALELLPDFPQALANRGIIYERTGKPDDAASNFEQAGLIHRKQGDCAKAIDEFGEALNDNPKQAISLYARGSCKTSMGDSSGGQSDIAAAVALDANVVSRFDKIK